MAEAALQERSFLTPSGEVRVRCLEAIGEDVEDFRAWDTVSVMASVITYLIVKTQWPPKTPVDTDGSDGDSASELGFFVLTRGVSMFYVYEARFEASSEPVWFVFEFIESRRLVLLLAVVYGSPYGADGMGAMTASTMEMQQQRLKALVELAKRSLADSFPYSDCFWSANNAIT